MHAHRYLLYYISIFEELDFNYNRDNNLNRWLTPKNFLS